MADGSSAEARVRVRNSVLFTPVDDRSVLLQLDTETYFELDAVGTRMWQALSENGSIADAVATLSTIYDAPRERIEADIVDLVRQLRNQGLVELA